MSTAGKGARDQEITASQEISTMTEEKEMKEVVVSGQNKLRVVYQEIAKVSEGIEMRLEMHISAVKNMFSNGPTTITPAKLLGGLAVGALLMTATALSTGLIDADGPSRPLTSSIPSFGEADVLDELEYEVDEGLISSADNRGTVARFVLDELEYEVDEGLISSADNRGTVASFVLDEIEYEEDEGLISSADNRGTVASFVLDEIEYEVDEGLISSADNRGTVASFVLDEIEYEVDEGLISSADNRGTVGSFVLDEMEYEVDEGLISSADNRGTVARIVLDELEYEEDEGLIISW